MTHERCVPAVAIDGNLIADVPGSFDAGATRERVCAQVAELAERFPV